MKLNFIALSSIKIGVRSVDLGLSVLVADAGLVKLPLLAVTLQL